MNLPDRYKKHPTKFSGGMSSAILCTDNHLDRKVIIKILQSGIDQKRLLDEVRSLSSVRSRHVVEVYDIIRNSAGKIRAVVVEYLSGDSLSTLIGKCTYEEIMLHSLSVARGIEDIHKSGLIHRDIKPDNIKFDYEGYLKIFDFGLSRPDDKAEAVTTGAVGTLGFMAPELLVDDDDTVEFTKAVDVFAFASTVLQLICGKLPSGLRKIPMVLPCVGGNFSNLPIKLPADVAAVLNSCHAENPASRPTIEEVRAVLERHILQGKHRASLIVGGKAYYLDDKNRSVQIKSGNRGSFTIEYDGLFFRISVAAGSVYVNNVPVSPPQAIKGSCVITLGPPEMTWDRDYVPIDVSHPEVLA